MKIRAKAKGAAVLSNGQGRAVYYPAIARDILAGTFTPRQLATATPYLPAEFFQALEVLRNPAHSDSMKRAAAVMVERWGVVLKFTGDDVPEWAARSEGRRTPRNAAPDRATRRK